MKKIFLFVALLFSCSVCFADTIYDYQPENVKQGYISENVFAPQWVDVCTYSAYWDIDTSKNYKKSEKKYWKERRIQFDKEVSACEAKGGDVSACYSAIISIEQERTAKWEATYKDERKQRAVKTAGTVGTVGVLGGITALILNILY